MLQYRVFKNILSYIFTVKTCVCSASSLNETSSNVQKIVVRAYLLRRGMLLKRGTGSGERGAGNGERKFGNELSAETSIKIQYGR